MNNFAVPTVDTSSDIYSTAIKQFSHYDHRNYHYLDSAATSQKPDLVIEAVTKAYRNFCAPVHRASYPHGEAATSAYEASRSKVASFINAEASQLVFTQSCTASINQVALGWVQPRIKPDQVIWLSRMEHNANYLPWRQLCESTGSILKIIEMDDQGRLLVDNDDIWNDRTFLIALTQCSNVLGGENPIQEVCDRAIKHGIFTLIDAAQSVSHLAIDVEKLGCDFLTFSAHKMYGPEGIGALYIKANHINELNPMFMGGGIVESLDESNIVMRPAPLCFEAGSPNLSGALGFAAAVDFIQGLGHPAVSNYIGALGEQFKQILADQPGVTLLPTAGGKQYTSVISFTLDNVHPHDIAHMAAEQGVAIRTGNHCSHLLLKHLGLSAVSRLSLGVYNSKDDISPLINAISMARHVFG